MLENKMSKGRFDSVCQSITMMYDETLKLRKENADLKERIKSAWDMIHEYEQREFKWLKFIHWFQVHQWDLWRHIRNYFVCCFGRGGQDV